MEIMEFCGSLKGWQARGAGSGLACDGPDGPIPCRWKDPPWNNLCERLRLMTSIPPIPFHTIIPWG